MTFLKGFRSDAWTACVILVLTLPACLFCFYLVLRSTGSQETLPYNYFWNLLIMLAGLAQQVTTDHNLKFITDVDGGLDLTVSML